MKLPPASTKASRRANDCFLSMDPIKSHFPPMDMAPRQIGETRTPAFGERIRYTPSCVLGVGAGLSIANMEGAILGASPSDGGFARCSRADIVEER